MPSTVTPSSSNSINNIGSVGASSTAAQRKKLEEKNSKILRELLTIPTNKYCFECGQRGPTYVNVSEGSFCCMHCSGLLRGLNPPHRVKSISMSTFSETEMLFIQSMGNEKNAKIWLGLCDQRPKFEPRVEDEIRQHLIQKYENKCWYVSPNDLAEQKILLDEAKNSTRCRRNSISSNSIQSNQSAPSNLHSLPPKEVNDPFNLLANNLFSTNSGNVTPSNFLSANLPTALQPPTTNKIPVSHSTQPAALNFSSSLQNTTKTNEKLINTSNKDFYSSTNNCDSIFAEFDSKFDSLKINNDSTTKTTTTKTTTNTSILNPSTTNIQMQPLVPERISMNRTPPKIPSRNPVTLQTDNKIKSFSPPITTQLQQQQQHVATTKDGRPIMSTSTTLPDYSALEELFRGSSNSSETTTTTIAPSAFINNLQQQQSIFSSTNEDKTNHLLLKSNTIGGFANFASSNFNGNEANKNQDGIPITPNPFFSMNNFSSKTPTSLNSNFHSTFLNNGFSSPTTNSANKSASNSVPNWNPFAN